MTTETEVKREELAYGVMVSCFPPLGAEVVKRMTAAGFQRYTGVERHFHQLSELGFVFNSPMGRGEAPPLPELPAGCRAGSRYLRILISLVEGAIYMPRNWTGEFCEGLCGVRHELDEDGRVACWACFLTGVKSGRFCG